MKNMKKHLQKFHRTALTGLLLFFFGTTFAQLTPPVMEDFDDATFPPQGWTQQSFSGDNVWSRGTNPTMIIGAGSAYAMGGGSGEVVSALVSPPITIPAQGNCKLTFFSKFMFPDTNSSYEIQISQTNADDAAAYTLLKALQTEQQNTTEFQEINVQIPDEYAGKTVYLAFVFNAQANAGFSAWSIDDFELLEISNDPVFKAESSADAGIAYNNIPFPAYAHLAVSNRGGSTLVIEGFSSTQTEISVPDLPFEIAPSETRNLDIQLDAYSTKLAHGPYTGQLKLQTNAPSMPEASIEITATIDSAITSTYLEEGFENAVLPKGWSTTAIDGQGNSSTGFGMEDVGRNNGKALRCELFTNRKQVSIRTPYVYTGDQPVMNFYYKVTDWTFSGQGQATSSENFKMHARLSKDNGLNWDTIYALEAGQHTPSQDYAQIQVSIDKHANELCLLEIVFEHISGDFYTDIDDITLGTPPANDLEMLNLAGNAILGINQTETYVATIRNKGMQTQTDYSISLRKADGTEIASLPGRSIAQGETADFEFGFTPESEGEMGIYAEIMLEKDENLANNKSQTLSLFVQPENITAISIGKGETTINLPINMEQAQSVSQTLYFPTEITSNGGLIEGIAYQTKMTDSYKEHILVYIGETEQNNLLSLIDPNSLELAFDGEIEFSSSDKAQLVIPFNTPYQYHGGNLVLYVYRPTAQAHTSQDLFYGFPTESYRSTGSGFLLSEIDPMNPLTFTVIASQNIPNLTLLMDLSETGSLSGHVLDANGNPCRNALVEIAGEPFSILADSSGLFAFPHLQAGDYQLQVSKFGFDTARIDVSIGKGSETEQDIRLQAILQFPVGGQITGTQAPDGLHEASVVLSGYKDYLCLSDEEGRFRMEAYAGQYAIKVFHGGYQTHNGILEINGADTNLQILLQEEPFPVRDVSAELKEGESTIRWEAPVPLSDFRYDAGIANSQFGFSSGIQRGVMGSAFRSQARLHDISWYLTEIGGKQTSVNVFVFALDSTGYPSQEILFSQTDVPTTVNEWCRFEFPEPVNAPHGFFIALSRTSGFLSIGTSNPTEEYPFQAQTHFYTGDYQARPFSAVEDPAEGMSSGYSFNFMIRATGEWMGETVYLNPGSETSLQAKAENEYALDMPQPLSYSIYRLEEGMTEAQHTLLAENIEELQYRDKEWSTLPDGHIYQYAVIAKYQDENLSPARLSNPLPKGMEVAFNVAITTNSGDSPEGAILTLTNQDSNPAHVYTDTAQGQETRFPAVWRGRYLLSIFKSGFDAYSATIDITDTALSHQAELIETIQPSYGLEVEITGNDALLSWNHAPYTFFDDMESHTDFSIEDIGEYTMFDFDGKPQYAIYDIYFPNNGYTGSFMVMNPSQTNPAADTRTFQAHSGNKYLACFSTTDASANNDWLILPKRSIGPDSRFSFFAQNFTQYYDTARFYVAVSKTDAPKSFEIISDGDYLQAPGQWTEFSFNLGEYAGQELYIAIVCVSDDASSILMIDDIAVSNDTDMPSNTTRNIPKNLQGYTVYLNDEEVANGILETQYNFANLPEGTYTAGVQAVYSTGVSEIASIEFLIGETGIVSQSQANLRVYPNPANDWIHIQSSSPVQKLRLLDCSGKIVMEQEGNAQSMNLSSCPAGVYILRVENGNDIMHFKLIKK